MNCSNCMTSNLEPKVLEPGLIVAVYQKCEGALISLMNYRFWLDCQGSIAGNSETPTSDVPDEQPEHVLVSSAVV